jgi:PKHD-type hydroxylase
LIDRTKILEWESQASQLELKDGYVGIDNASDNLVRKSSIAWIHSKRHSQLYKSISDTLLPLIDGEMIYFRVDIFRTLEIQYTTYYEGGFYAKHSDLVLGPDREKGPQRQRKLSAVIMLSDSKDYGGGELVVGKQTIPNEIGTVCLFLPFMTHEVKPVTAGVRKTLVVWAMGPEWR